MPFTHHLSFTPDPDAAVAFYAALGITIAPRPLPERLRAAGVPPHLLGVAVVADLDVRRDALIAVGAQPLGPARDGFARLRDPQGAVFAIASAAAEGPAVGDAMLHTRDVDAAHAFYAPLFGWPAPREVESPIGRTLELGGCTIRPTATLVGVHYHWLFHLLVDDFEAALARAEAAGARLLHREDGRAQLEDPQGAAIGLVSRARVEASASG